MFCTNFQGVEKLKSKLNVLTQEKANHSNSNSIGCIGFNFYFFFNMYLNFKGFEKLKSESNALNQEKAEHANLKSIL